MIRRVGKISTKIKILNGLSMILLKGLAGQCKGDIDLSPAVRLILVEDIFTQNPKYGTSSQQDPYAKNKDRFVLPLIKNETEPEENQQESDTNSDYLDNTNNDPVVPPTWKPTWKPRLATEMSTTSTSTWTPMKTVGRLETISTTTSSTTTTTTTTTTSTTRKWLKLLFANLSLSF